MRLCAIYTASRQTAASLLLGSFARAPFVLKAYIKPPAMVAALAIDNIAIWFY